MTDLGLKPTLLLVDDEPTNIELLRNVLAPNYRLKVATDGESALRIVYGETPPDLILLDVMMPGMSGHDVCRRLKANPERRDIPVIFVTARTADEDERTGLALGAVDYITKPFRPAIVEARVRTHLALYNQSRETERMVEQRTGELLAARRQLMATLARASASKDDPRGRHGQRVGYYARLLGLRAGLGNDAAEVLLLAAPLHDIGNLALPDALLNKPGPLSAEERAQARRHPELGATLIGEHDDVLLATARTIALSHHERWNGTGYPYGLRGESIPIAGRIVALADVLDVMLSKRPYKPALPLDQALKYLTEQSGKHFDPGLCHLVPDLLAEIMEARQTLGDPES